MKNEITESNALRDLPIETSQTATKFFFGGKMKLSEGEAYPNGCSRSCNGSYQGIVELRTKDEEEREEGSI